MYAGQPGATEGPGGFAVFDTYEDGYNALLAQLNLYAAGTCAACEGQPQTIASTFQIYAPASQAGNNPDLYASNVAAALGVDPSTPLASVLGPGISTDLTTPVDLSSIGLPGVTIDPTTLIIGGLLVALVVGLTIAK
jgi:hypothetical protein